MHNQPIKSVDISSKYLSAQPLTLNEDINQSSVQHRPVVSRFGMSPMRASDVRSNLTFEDKVLNSKHRVFTNTLSKSRNGKGGKDGINNNSGLRSEDRYINLDGVVEI